MPSPASATISGQTIPGQLPVYAGQGAAPVGGQGGQLQNGGPLLSGRSRQWLNQIGAANPTMAGQMQQGFNQRTAPFGPGGPTGPFAAAQFGLAPKPGEQRVEGRMMGGRVSGMPGSPGMPGTYTGEFKPGAMGVPVGPGVHVGQAQLGAMGATRAPRARGIEYRRNGGPVAGFIGDNGTHGRLRMARTGGYGAEPAMPGRIGYRGELKEPGLHGLDELYAMRQRGFGQQAQQKQINPVTGLSYAPSGRDIMSQLRYIYNKPEEFEGMGGAQQGDALARYYFAPDEQARNEAAQNIMQMKGRLNALRKQGRTSQNMSPVPIAKTNTGTLPNEDETAAESYGLKDGGEETAVKPYIVNEQGTEAWKPDGGRPQLIQGGEQMVAFPKDGEVIPHEKTMEMVAEGKIEPPEKLARGGKNKATRDAAYAKAEELARSLEHGKSAQEGASRAQEAMASAQGPLQGLWSNYIKPAAENLPGLEVLGKGVLWGDPTWLQKKIAEALSGDPVAAAKAKADLDYYQAEMANPDAGAETGADAPPPAHAGPIDTAGIMEEARRVAPVATRPKPTGPVDTGAIMEEARRVAPLQSPPTVAAPPASQAAPPAIKTPTDAELLAEAEQMRRAGITQQKAGAKHFAGGATMEGGKITGPYGTGSVTQFEQKPVVPAGTIRPGVIKDELGDVGQRAVDKADDEAFMKRWEADLGAKPRKKGGRTAGYMTK